MLKARLLNAKGTLVEASPFLGSLVLMLPVTITEDPRVRTAAVDGHGRCYFGKTFLEALKVPELRSVLLHETLHLALDVHARRGTRKHLRWNVAHDFAINLLIEESNFPSEFLAWPEDFRPLLDPELHGLSAEEIYEGLPTDLSTLGLCPEDVLFDLWENLSPEEREELRRSWREKLVSAAERCMEGKGIGDLPGWAQKLLGPILNPQVPWEVQLAHRVHGHLRGRRRTFSRPGRRSQALSVCLPGPVRDRGAVGVFVDVSGSVSAQELGNFMGELTGILRDADLPVRLITWDAGVQEDLWLDNPEDVHEALASRTLALTGGGGTDPRCVIDHLDQDAGASDNPQPAFGILLTDGEVPWPSADDWPIEVLVVSTGDEPPPELGYESIHISPGATE